MKFYLLKIRGSTPETILFDWQQTARKLHQYQPLLCSILHLWCVTDISYKPSNFLTLSFMSIASEFRNFSCRRNRRGRLPMDHRLLCWVMTLQAQSQSCPSRRACQMRPDRLLSCGRPRTCLRPPLHHRLGRSVTHMPLRPAIATPARGSVG
jgi:hypothetical protein